MYNAKPTEQEMTEALAQSLLIYYWKEHVYQQ